MFNVDRFNNLPKFFLFILLADQIQHFPRFVDAPLLHEPSWTARYVEEKEKEHRCGSCGYAEFPAPLRCAKRHGSNDKVRKIGYKNAKHDAELKEAYQPAAPLRGRNLRNIHGAEYGGTADRKSGDKAKRHEGEPIPRKSASQRRDEKKDGEAA